MAGHIMNHRGASDKSRGNFLKIPSGSKKFTYRDILTAKTNGNVTDLEQITANFRQHSDLLHTDPGKLPTAAECDGSYLSYAGFVRSQEAADE